MIKSMDDKVIKNTDTNEYIYDTTDVLRSLPSLISEYNSIEYKNTFSNELYESIEEELLDYFDSNKQKIVLRDVIVYDRNLNIADTISIITKREYEDAHGIPQINFYFYNFTDYENGISYTGKKTEEYKYGMMRLPFKYLKNSDYYAESLRMAYIATLGGLGDDVHGKFLIDPHGKDMIVPCFPMRGWFKEDNIIHARYPRFSDGKIYNTEYSGIEHTYLL